MEPADPFKYDVFVSYRQQPPDQAWARSVLIPALDDAGFAVCVDYRSFTLGASIIESMAEAVRDSRYTVIIMTTAYFASGFTTFERILAQHLGLEERRRRVIGLALDQVEVPTELRPYLWLDVGDVTHRNDPALGRLIETLRSNPA